MTMIESVKVWSNAASSTGQGAAVSTHRIVCARMYRCGSAYGGVASTGPATPQLPGHADTHNVDTTTKLHLVVSTRKLKLAEPATPTMRIYGRVLDMIPRSAMRFVQRGMGGGCPSV